DHVLCDPLLRSQFDETAARLVQKVTAVKLRCAALNLRKTHKLRPTDLSSDTYDLVAAGPVRTVSFSSIGTMPGIYAFYDYSRPIYVSETDNLRRRIETHLESGLPDWLKKATGDEGFVLKYQVLPSAPREARLKMVASFINKERPVLNYQKA